MGVDSFSSLFLNLFVEEKNPYLHKPFLCECCQWDKLEFRGSAPHPHPHPGLLRVLRGV